METAPLRVALAGGGTGGHVVPGLHLLAHAKRRERATDVLWFGAGRAIEDRVFAGGARNEEGVGAIRRVALALEPPRGGAPSRLRLAATIAPAVLQARRAMARQRTSVCVGLGGYTVVPAALAARSLGIPVVLLEVNAQAGLATRWLSRIAHVVAHAWPTSVPEGGQENHVVLGPPLGPRFLDPTPAGAEVDLLRRGLGLEPGTPLLVVLGGSQGALGLNRFCRERAGAFVDRGLQVLHQVGPGRLAEAGPERAGYHPIEFLDDVCSALDAADVVLCRGGASTLAEVAARAKPAFVVPYPHHADRHQEKNALLFGDGLRILPEEDLGDDAFEEMVALALPGGAAERARRSSLLAQQTPRDGAHRLLDLVLDTIETV